MRPADECFAAGDLARLDVDDRLVMQLEFAICDGLAQSHCNLVPALQPFVHTFYEETECAAAERLCAVERHVRVLHQLLDVNAVGRSHRNSDARSDRNRVFTDNERLRQLGYDALGTPFDLCERLRGNLYDCELIATQPGNGVGVPYGAD